MCRMQGVRCRVQGCRVQNLGSFVFGFIFRLRVVASANWDAGCWVRRIQGSVSRILRFRVSD
jgi:hypothetical protein